MNKNYENYNAAAVLLNVEKRIEELENNPSKSNFRIMEVYDELSIFDWWKDTISLNKLKDMRKFLKEAVKLGFTGYVCFKVGASGCANGMWAHNVPTTNGFSPESDFLYKSFTPDYNCWQLHINGVSMPSRETNEEFDKLTTIKKLEDYISDNNLLFANNM